MCTVTLVPLQAGREQALRLGFSRDESRLRLDGLAPRIVRVGDRRAVMPRDPASGGTWVAASDEGVILGIMNMHPGVQGALPAGKRSRGEIIPTLLAFAGFNDTVAAAAALPADQFAPFRLLIASLGGAVAMEHRGDGRLITGRITLNTPAMFTSSGLGDARVAGPRRELFEAMLSPPSARAQDRFHRHRWPERPHLSVCMSRSDARTVSYTTIELTANRVRVSYLADAPDQPVMPEMLVLPVERREAACSS